MSGRDVVVVVEDELSEAVVRKIIYATGGRTTMNRCVVTRGSGDLRKGMAAKYAEASRVIPHLVLTDLDRYECAPALLADWRLRSIPSSLLFRIVVRETEAWLLADRDAIADFLGIPKVKVCQQPELEEDPKRTLINLARRCRSKRLRDELVPAPESRAEVGPVYNERMSAFVQANWDVQRASQAAPSLLRAVHRLSTFPPCPVAPNVAPRPVNDG